jgi:hypothetical protein
MIKPEKKHMKSKTNLPEVITEEELQAGQNLHHLAKEDMI